uniref:Uncharacterized protein n=1 Tax=Octopus bimaculoides TaxID=37653 RepID=A0A0L8GB96_OCTBM
MIRKLHVNICIFIYIRQNKLMECFYVLYSIKVLSMDLECNFLISHALLGSINLSRLFGFL